MSRNRHGKRDSRHYFEWMEYASEDLDAALQLYEGGTCFNAAGFHCQQTIEKSLKAYLLFMSGQTFDGHNLSWLMRQACKYNSRFNCFISETALLNRYYVECRYPSDNWENPDRQIIDRNIGVTRELYEYVCSLIYEDDYDSDHFSDK